MNTPTPDPRPNGDPDVYADNQRLQRQVEDLTAERDFARTEAKSIYATCKQIEGERDVLREVARSNKRHVAELTAIVESVSALTVSTDGDPIDHDAEIPVGEIVRALNEPAAPAVRPVEPSAVPAEGSGHPHPATGRHGLGGNGRMSFRCASDDDGCDDRACICWCHTGTSSNPMPVLSNDTPEGATNEH